MLSHLFFFFFNDTATTEIYTRFYTLSLHDALPIYLLHLPMLKTLPIPGRDVVLAQVLSGALSVVVSQEIGRAHV